MKGLCLVVTIKRILSDIRHGENIDLYMVIAIAFPLAILSIVGIAPQSWIAPLTMTVLSLLAISMLVTRRIIETIRSQRDNEGGLRYLTAFPPNLADDISGARELWLVGISLRSTMKAYLSVFEEKLKRGDRIRVLLMDPSGSMIKTSLSRSKHDVTERTARDDIEQTLHHWCLLGKELASGTPVRLEIRTLDYPLPFGAYVVNPNSGNGLIYWENYTYMSQFEEPKSVISISDRAWFDFYRLQIESLWAKAVEWGCQGEVPSK